MPVAETLYTGDSPLKVLEFGRDEVVKKLRNIKQTGDPGPDMVWSKFSMLQLITWVGPWQ